MRQNRREENAVTNPVLILTLLPLQCTPAELPALSTHISVLQGFLLVSGIGSEGKPDKLEILEN